MNCQRRKYLEPFAAAMFGPALLVMWYCSPVFRGPLNAFPGVKRRGPVLMIRIFAKSLATDSASTFGIAIMIVGANCGAFLNTNPLIGAGLGLASVVAFFNAIPFFLPMPSTLFGRA